MDAKSPNDYETFVLKEMEWNTEHEEIFIEWADKALCYRWLHSKCNTIYNNYNMMFTIPVIIIATITGTANFAQDRIDPEYLSVYVMVIGSLNIFAGIISTVQQFLKISDLKESHRISSIAWDKFYRNIKIELSKKPKERIPVAQMLKIYKEEYDRLMETSPVIRADVIHKFNETFGKTEEFVKLRKPEICDSLSSTSNFLYNPKELNKTKPFINKLKKQINENKTIINNFISDFEKINDRKPLEDEIIESLENRIPASKIKQYLKTINQEKNDIAINVNQI